MYTTVSIMQLANWKVAQPKPGAFRHQVCLCWTMPRPTRMSDSPAKKPTGIKATSKLMPSASSPEQGQLFVSAPNQTGLDTRSNDPKVQIIVEIRRRKGRVRAEARALLDYAGHRPSKCNVGLMSLAGHGSKYGSRHRCLIIA